MDLGIDNRHQGSSSLSGEFERCSRLVSRGLTRHALLALAAGIRNPSQQQTPQPAEPGELFENTGFLRAGVDAREPRIHV
jgi:hypothetical protein